MYHLGHDKPPLFTDKGRCLAHGETTRQENHDSQKPDPGYLYHTLRPESCMSCIYLYKGAGPAENSNGPAWTPGHLPNLPISYQERDKTLCESRSCPLETLPLRHLSPLPRQEAATIPKGRQGGPESNSEVVGPWL